MFLGLEFMQFKILLCAVKAKIIKMFCQQIFLFEIGLQLVAQTNIHYSSKCHKNTSAKVGPNGEPIATP